MSKYNSFLLLICLWAGIGVSAQELNCKFRIQTPNLQMVDPVIFKTLEADMNEFLNNRKWTSDAFSPEEKINCNINLTINAEKSSNRFQGELTIQADRPVLNSSYQSPLFIHKDNDVEFEYSQFSALEFDENAFISNLTSVLAFYVYTVLGLEYDSFTRLGGTALYQRAQNIINNAGNSNQGFVGWKANESLRNRYWMNENLLNPKYQDMREAYYIYHRQGMDLMFENVSAGRKGVNDAIKKVESVFNQSQNNYLVKVFTNTKNEEIQNIFGDASVPNHEKAAMINVLVKVDPINARKFQEMNKYGTTGPAKKVPIDGRMPDKGN